MSATYTVRTHADAAWRTDDALPSPWTQHAAQDPYSRS
jgi:hypothetical protein